METHKDQLQSLLQRVENRERIARRRAVIYTVIPFLFGGILILVVGGVVIRAQRELANAKSELRMMIEVTNQLEDFFERQDTTLFIRTEARSMIAMRMMFDTINEEFEISSLGPEMPQLGRGRVWITIVGSYSTLNNARQASPQWVNLYGADHVAIYLTKNNYYALAISGDGTFTSAYELTAELKQGPAYDAYFVAAHNWGENLLQ